MSCTLRSCTQPQHCHSPGSSSCHCVLSETQPDSDDKAANIHRQEFLPASGFAYACLAALAARGFTSSVAFVSSNSPVGSSIPASLPQCYIHTFFHLSSNTWRLSSVRKNRDSPQLHTWRVHCWFVAWLASVWEWLAWAATPLLGSSYYENERFDSSVRTELLIAEPISMTMWS